MVVEYINTIGKGVPIFKNEIEEYIIDIQMEMNDRKAYNNVKAILHRMNNEGLLEKAYS
jgi:hypothetical protein